MIWPRLLILRSLPLLLFNELLNWGIVTRCRYCRFHLNVAMSPALCPTCNWAWGRLFLVFMFIFTVSVSNCIWEPFRGSKFNWKPCNLFLHTDVLWKQNSFDWTYIHNFNSCANIFISNIEWRNHIHIQLFFSGTISLKFYNILCLRTYGVIMLFGNGEKNKAKLSNLLSEYGSDLHWA